MTVEYTEFKGGLPLDPQNTDPIEQIKKAIKQDTVQKTVTRLTPGSYDLTPHEWKSPNYRYWVNVDEHGTGTLRMVPAVEGVASRFTEETEWTKGVREHPIFPGADPVVIAGGSKTSSSGLAAYKLVYWAP